MTFLKKKDDPSTLPPNTIGVIPGSDSETGTAEDVENIMKKYDRESNVRVWEGIPKQIVRWIMVIFSVYSIWVTLFSTALPERRLTIFMAMILIIGYLNFPIRKGHVRVNSLPWYDCILIAMGAVPLFYFAINAYSIVKMATRISRSPFLLTLGIIGLISIVELCRRSVGLPILCVAGALIIYTLTQVRPQLIVYNLFYTTAGIMNTPVNVCAKFIVVFIIFGAFLERTGIASFFIELANSIAGSSAGGPAKVAVLSSALCGMVSGSSVGNTVTTGSVTIPMMKKTGYKPEFAGAVEAASSTGGQIMPPIMGAAAFLMAEYLGVSYASIVVCAILPAVLYFTGIYIAVHLEAKKLGLKGIPREQLTKFRVLIKKAYLLAPLVVLVILVSTNAKTMQFSATLAIGVAIFVGLFNKDDRITFNKFLDALEAGGKSTITVAVACAMAGIIAGCITITGLASKLITAIVTISGGHAFVALFLTMLCCIVLGMGVPTTANYCIMASTCAPILTNAAIGITPLAAHFFVFYFGIVADITPPVALAAYAGSAIAKAPPMKTAFNATRLAIAAFIVPYIFALNPAMLFVDTTAMEVVLIVITSIIGLFAVSAALTGHLFCPINPIFRILLVAGGLCMMVPGALTDVIGIAVVASLIALQYIKGKRTATPAI